MYHNGAEVNGGSNTARDKWTGASLKPFLLEWDLRGCPTLCAFCKGWE